MSCPYKNVVDDQDCPICLCNTNPCGDDSRPLQNDFYGRGVNRQDCPQTHFSKIDPADRFAVYCPKPKRLNHRDRRRKPS